MRESLRAATSAIARTAVAGCLLLMACQTDSGQAATSGPSGTPCADHKACQADELCGPTSKPAHCRKALPQDYVLTLQSAQDFAPYDDDAKAWDPDGPPDPYATVEQEAQGGGKATIVCQSPVAENAMLPTWNKPCHLHLSPGDKISFAVWDEDGSKDKLMMMTTLSAQELVELLRSGDGQGSANATARLLFSVALP